jgi:predicted metalloprotease with PDZ domain
MRELDRRARAKPGSFAVDRRALLAAIRRTSKLDLTRQLARWIDRPGDLAVKAQLARFGVQLARKSSRKVDYGFDADRRVRGVLVVSKVRRGGPGARAGLVPGDQILLVDNRPPRVWPGWHHQLRAQRSHRLVVLRAGRTLILSLRTGTRVTHAYQLVAPKRPSALYRGWNR